MERGAGSAAESHPDKPQGISDSLQPSLFNWLVATYALTTLRTTYDDYPRQSHNTDNIAIMFADD